MKWLLWKDFRVNRVVFIAALVLLIIPHALVAILIWRAVKQPDPAGLFGPSSFYSLGLLQLVFALLGGNSIAGERFDRSAEFLAYLPVSRGRILASKLLVSLAAVPLVWLPNLAVLATAVACRPSVLPDADAVPLFLSALSTIAITGITFFCVAWLFSCMLLSPTFSVCMGVLAPILVISGIYWVCDLLDLKEPRSWLIIYWYWGLCLVISVPSFLSGTLYYLRRVEP